MWRSVSIYLFLFWDRSFPIWLDWLAVSLQECVSPLPHCWNCKNEPLQPPFHMHTGGLNWDPHTCWQTFYPLRHVSNPCVPPLLSSASLGWVWGYYFPPLGSLMSQQQPFCACCPSLIPWVNFGYFHVGPKTAGHPALLGTPEVSFYKSCFLMSLLNIDSHPDVHTQGISQACLSCLGS